MKFAKFASLSEAGERLHSMEWQHDEEGSAAGNYYAEN